MAHRTCCTRFGGGSIVVVPSPRKNGDPLVLWCPRCGALGFTDGDSGFAWQKPGAAAPVVAGLADRMRDMVSRIAEDNPLEKGDETPSYWQARLWRRLLSDLGMGAEL